MTWQDVQTKLIEVQSSHQMCIHKKELTELGKYSLVKSSQLFCILHELLSIYFRNMNFFYLTYLCSCNL